MCGRRGAGYLEAVGELVLVGQARPFIDGDVGVACVAGRVDVRCVGVGDYVGGLAGGADASGVEEYSQGVLTSEDIENPQICKGWLLFYK